MTAASVSVGGLVSAVIRVDGCYWGIAIVGTSGLVSALIGVNECGWGIAGVSASGLYIEVASVVVIGDGRLSFSWLTVGHSGLLSFYSIVFCCFLVQSNKFYHYAHIGHIYDILFQCRIF